MYSTHKGGCPTWRKREAGIFETHLKSIHHGKREKDGGHDNLDDRDHLQVSSVVHHFTLDFGKMCKNTAIN